MVAVAEDSNVATGGARNPGKFAFTVGEPG